MSVLNLPNDGLPNVFVVLFQSLSDVRGGLGEESLLARLEPPGLLKGQPKLANTLRRWHELGIFVEKGGRYTVTESYRANVKPGEPIPLAHIRTVARKAAFATENNQRLWEAGASRSADLTRSLAWLLAQDVYELNWVTLPQIELNQLVREDLCIAKNDVRLNGLRTWGSFLGFLWSDGRAYIVDPTVAIRDVVSNVLPDGEEIAVDKFVDALAAELPVLDGGTYRRDVESHLDRKHYTQLPQGTLSKSLSRAFYRLRREGTLEWVLKSDAGAGVKLTGTEATRRADVVTHIKRSVGN
jgi:hypothetical protein